MKTLQLFLLSIASVTTFTAHSQIYKSVDPSQTDNGAIPERAIILSGGQNGLNREVLAVLYDTNELHFQDPETPRFLLIDRLGTTVFGIGGYIEGLGYADFDGGIDGGDFPTYNIPIPTDPTYRSQIGANAQHTSLVMQLATKTKFGVLSAYVNGNFTGANYGFKLKQAYVRLHNLTAGLTRSTFQDALSGVPTIDPQGPSGAISDKNVLLQYKVNVKKHLTFAISAEMPEATYTDDTHTEEISQRFPDLPAFAQYQWDGGKSHVRVSAIFRNLSYRNLSTGENHFAQGWGLQLSGAVRCSNIATIFYQGAYGKGISSYFNDIKKHGFDLIPGGEDGMIAPTALGIVGGVRFNITHNLFVSSSYSLCRLYDQGHLGGDTYRRGNYAVVNAFYSPIPDLQIGIEYLHGRRTNMDLENSTANRIEAMVKYSF